MDEKTDQKPDTVDIFYDKSPQYRTIHPGGAWAAITPDAEIELLFFTNLTPAPEYVRQRISDGKLGEQTDKIMKKGIAREYEVGILLSKGLAEELIKLLGNMIGQIPQTELKLAVREDEL